MDGDILDRAKACLDRACELEKNRTPETLQAAVSIYGEVIRLYGGLDISVADCRHDLLAAYVSQGDVLREIGTPDALRASVLAYGHAIHLGADLDMTVAKFRTGLAAAYCHRALASSQIGTADALQASNLDLIKGLELKIPYGQESARINQGEDEKKSDTVHLAQSIQVALSASDELIRKFSALDLSVEDNRKELANLYLQRGGILKCAGTLDSLQAALSAYDEAIRLYVDLDLEIAEFRYDLAIAYMLRGFLLQRIASSDALEAAEESFDEALREFSTEELAGYLKAPEWRAECFSELLNCQLKLTAFRFIPEIVLEQLDPGSPNSVPASFAMHRSALSALLQGTALCARQPQLNVLLPEYFRALDRLKEIRTRYLPGSLEGVLLRVEDKLARGDSNSAVQMLAQYCDRTSKSPSGWLAYAEFLLRLGKVQGARDAFIEAARRHVYALRHHSSDDMVKRSDEIGKIALAVFRLLAPDVSNMTESPAGCASVLAAVNAVLEDSSRHWIALRDRILSLPDGETELGSELQLRWRSELEPQLSLAWGVVQRELVALRDGIMRHEAQSSIVERCRSVVDAMREQARQFAAMPEMSLGQGWGAFVQRLQFAWADVLECVLEDGESASASEHAKASIEAALANAFEKHTESLVLEDAEREYATLEQWLGPEWRRQLSDQECKCLVAGLRLSNDPALMRYAGLELGLAVEISIRQHFLDPLRSYAESPEIIQAPSGKGTVSSALRYVRGNGVLMLGQLVEFLLLALEHDTNTTSSHPVVTLAARAVGQWPGSSQLSARMCSDAGRAALEEIKRVRNDCAHGHEAPDAVRLKHMLDNVIGSEEHGFFRYWTLARHET